MNSEYKKWVDGDERMRDCILKSREIFIIESLPWFTSFRRINFFFTFKLSLFV